MARVTDRSYLPLIVEKIGAENLMDFIPPSPDSAQSILYTSGTTGNVSSRRHLPLGFVD